MSKRNKMPGLRLKGGIWQIEKRCKYAAGGWLRESTGTAGRAEAEQILIRRLMECEEEARRKREHIYSFEEAGMRYLEESAAKPSADDIAMHLDKLFPFIGAKSLAQVHDGTLKPFVDHETAKGNAPKTVNLALGVVSAVLHRAARVWRDENGDPWLRQAPPRLTRLPLAGKQAKPYPLSWDQQDRLFRILPGHLAAAALFALNTGCREQEVCRLRWDREVTIPAMNRSVFILPEAATKTKTERVIVLNAVASRVIASRRGMHKELVFTYRGKPLGRLHTSAWNRGWKKAGLPQEPGILKGVHNLRHTFGRRLRSAGVALETRKALLGHAHGDITTHYSAAELSELIAAAEKITDRGTANTPTMTVISRERKNGNLSEKVSETKKGLPEKFG